jgi:hypothetical protein
MDPKLDKKGRSSCSHSLLEPLLCRLFKMLMKPHTPLTSPYNPFATGNHFQRKQKSEEQLAEAVEECDEAKFQSRMHRLQDYWTHYRKGFRWGPIRHRRAPGGGWGHVFNGGWPDRDNRAFELAQAATSKWLKEWLQKCCTCKCDWRKKDPGPCDANQPSIVRKALPMNFDPHAWDPENNNRRHLFEY